MITWLLPADPRAGCPAGRPARRGWISGPCHGRESVTNRAARRNGHSGRMTIGLTVVAILALLAALYFAWRLRARGAQAIGSTGGVAEPTDARTGAVPTRYDRWM